LIVGVSVVLMNPMIMLMMCGTVVPRFLGHSISVSASVSWRRRQRGIPGVHHRRAARRATARAWHHGSVDDGSQERYYHGTRADLQPGDLIEPGYHSNFGSRKKANHVYLTATVDAAVWGAELAVGEGPGRIYLVEPTGPIEDDPNLTDKKFPGNPTKSYRSRAPLRVTGELADWEGHPADVLQTMQDNLERLKLLGVEAIDD
jgi:rifampin ADP-ribosylating transferase